jgi:hypothetical protein
MCPTNRRGWGGVGRGLSWTYSATNKKTSTGNCQKMAVNVFVSLKHFRVEQSRHEGLRCWSYSVKYCLRTQSGAKQLKLYTRLTAAALWALNQLVRVVIIRETAVLISVELYNWKSVRLQASASLLNFIQVSGSIALYSPPHRFFFCSVWSKWYTSLWRFYRFPSSILLTLFLPHLFPPLPVFPPVVLPCFSVGLCDIYNNSSNNNGNECLSCLLSVLYNSHSILSSIHWDRIRFLFATFRTVFF